MSEYADLCIKKLNLCTFRNYLDEDIVNMFFSKRDLSVIPGCKYDPEEKAVGCWYLQADYEDGFG